MEKTNDKQTVDAKKISSTVFLTFLFFAVASIAIYSTIVYFDCKELNYYKQSFKCNDYFEIKIDNFTEVFQDNKYIATVSFSITNTSAVEQKFDLSRIYLKNDETGHRYEGKVALLSVLVPEVIEADETQKCNVSFNIPTSVYNSKYTIYIPYSIYLINGIMGTHDWSSTKCALYYENGDLISIRGAK